MTTSPRPVWLTYTWIAAETSTVSISGFTGSVTIACRPVLWIGSLRPAFCASTLEWPATAISTRGAATGPCVVSTPSTRSPRIVKPVTSQPCTMSTPSFPAARANAHTTASWREMPPRHCTAAPSMGKRLSRLSIGSILASSRGVTISESTPFSRIALTVRRRTSISCGLCASETLPRWLSMML